MKRFTYILLVICLISNLSAQQSNDTKQLLKSGHEKLKFQDFTGAIKDFNKASRINPALNDAYTGRANAKYNLLQYDEALRDINKSIEIKSELPEAYLIRGKIFAATKKNTEALADFNKALELNETFFDAITQKAIFVFQQEREKEAFELINKALDKSPNTPELYYGRGVLYNMKQKYEKSLIDFNKCIELNADYDQFNILLSRGAVNLALQEFKMADDDFTKVIELAPNMAIGYSSRARGSYEQGNYNEAITDYNKAIELNPENAGNIFNLGMAYYKMNDNKNACEHFRKSCSMHNSNACKMVVIGCGSK